MAVYIIADLHLSAARPELLRAFTAFCSLIPDGSRFIIAGDLFDVYVGFNPDDPAQLCVRRNAEQLQKRRIQCFFQCGNRDFLLDDAAAHTLNLSLLPDLYTCSDGQKFLLMHGDLLCTHDLKYQKFRALTSKAWLRYLFLHLPLALRLKLGSRVRGISQEQAPGRRDPKIYGVVPEAVEQYCAQTNMRTLVHGHLHTPGTWQHETKSCKLRICLSDWGRNYSYVKADTQGISLKLRALSDLLEGKVTTL